MPVDFVPSVERDSHEVYERTKLSRRKWRREITSSFSLLTVFRCRDNSKGYIFLNQSYFWLRKTIIDKEKK